MEKYCVLTVLGPVSVLMQVSPTMSSHNKDAVWVRAVHKN